MRQSTDTCAPSKNAMAKNATTKNATTKNSRPHHSKNANARRVRQQALSLVALTSLIGCAFTPDLSEHAHKWGDDSEWVSLISSEELAALDIAQNQTAQDQTSVAGIQTLNTRVQALRARAEALSARPVLSGAERRRLTAAIARHTS